jgi:hypothetical protein
MLASGTQDRGFKPGLSRQIFSGRKKSPAVVREVVTDRAKLPGQFLAQSCPPSLIEGSVRLEQSVASPGGGGPRARSGFGAICEMAAHSERSGAALRGVAGSVGWNALIDDGGL